MRARSLEVPVRVDFDHAFTMATAVGARGLRREALQALVPRVGRGQDRLATAKAGGQLPYAAPDRANRAKRAAELAGCWAREVERMVVVGEPGAARAAMLLARAAGDRDTIVIDSPDPEALDRVLAAQGRVGLVVLDGPRWVRDLGGMLAERAVATWVFDADGPPAEPWMPPRGARFEGGDGADPRFGVIGPAALALAARAGANLDAIVAALDQAEARCLAPALFTNPAWRCAATIYAFGQEGVVATALLAPGGLMAAWAAWAASAWAAVAVKSVDRGALRAPGGQAPQVVAVGDESWVQRLVEGDPDLLTFALWADDPGVDRPVGRVSAWYLARSMLGAHIQQLVEGGRPVLRIRLSDLSPASLAAASYLWLDAVVALAVLCGADPLAMDAADRWRLIQASEFGPAGD